jgi:hypothetical protein
LNRIKFLGNQKPGKIGNWWTVIIFSVGIAMDMPA